MSITGTAFQTAIVDQIFSERNSLAKTFPKSETMKIKWLIREISKITPSPKQQNYPQTDYMRERKSCNSAYFSTWEVAHKQKIRLLRYLGFSSQLCLIFLSWSWANDLTSHNFSASVLEWGRFCSLDYLASKQLDWASLWGFAQYLTHALCGCFERKSSMLYVLL